VTTVLLNIHNAGFFPVGSMILAMGAFYGGVAQIITGILEYKKRNTFGMTAFISYGLFWWTLVFIFVFKNLPGTPEVFMGWYLFMWVSLRSSCGLELLEKTGQFNLFF
jgi:uncharacterized protein